MPARHLRVDRQTIILQNYAGAGGDACYGLRHGGRPALWRLHDARQLEIIGNRPSNLVPVGPILSPGSGITCHYHQADDQQASCQIPQCNCPRGCGQRPNAHWRCCREGDPRYSHDPPPLSLRWKPALHSAGTFKHNFVEFRVSPKLCYLNAIKRHNMCEHRFFVSYCFVSYCATPELANRSSHCGNTRRRFWHEEHTARRQPGPIGPHRTSPAFVPMLVIPTHRN
jgi:hypothetical protein